MQFLLSKTPSEARGFGLREGSASLKLRACRLLRQPISAFWVPFRAPWKPFVSFKSFLASFPFTLRAHSRTGEALGYDRTVASSGSDKLKRMNQTASMNPRG